MKRLIYLGCLLLLTGACEKTGNPNETIEQELVLDENDKSLVSAINAFSIKLFNKVNNSVKDDENLLLSPYSASIALSMANNGATAETHTAIKKTFGFEELEEEAINKSFKKLITGVPLVSAKNRLSIANSIWFNDQLDVVPDFLQTTEAYYLAQATKIPFKNPEAPDKINEWARKATNDKIDNVISQVQEKDLMYLLNAVYFKGIWEQKFDKNQTEKSTFFKNNGIKGTADFMKNTAIYKTYSTTNYTAVELPYADKKYSMVLVKGKSGNQLMESDIKEIVSLPKPVESTVAVWVPKFKFAFEKELNDDLKELGMGIAFGDEADFSRMTGDSKKTKISTVKQKTYIDVDEEGTEAAAVTVVGIETTSSPMVQTVKFDEPFYFVIKENSSNLLLFIGKVNDPEK